MPLPTVKLVVTTCDCCDTRGPVRRIFSPDKQRVVDLCDSCRAILNDMPLPVNRPLPPAFNSSVPAPLSQADGHRGEDDGA